MDKVYGTKFLFYSLSTGLSSWKKVHEFFSYHKAFSKWKNNPMEDKKEVGTNKRSFCNK